MNCRKCKDWNACRGRECLICGKRTIELFCEPCKAETQLIRKHWYHYGEIRWCPFQNMWILQNFDLLDQGEWPPDPENPDESARTQFRTEAYFVKAKIVTAEIKLRLETTDALGILLREQCENGKTLEELHPEAYAVLMYISKRRHMGFNAWRRNYRWKNGKKFTKP